MSYIKKLTLHSCVQELYHELNALDRFEQDYRRKLEEVEALHLPRKGGHSSIFHLQVVLLSFSSC